MFNRIILVLSCLILAGCLNSHPHVTVDEEISPEQAKASALLNAHLAMGYLQEGQRERAKVKLNKAFAYGPKVPEVFTAFAYFYEQNSEFKKATNAYHEALRLAPKSGVVHNNYGAFLCKRKKYKEAIDHFETAVKDPLYTTIASAYENAGMCAQKIPNRAQAARFFTKALQHDPNRASSLLALAQLEYQAKQYQSSRDKLAKYLKNNKSTPESLLLSAKLARYFHDPQTLLASRDALKAQYPKSREYRWVKRFVK